MSAYVPAFAAVTAARAASAPTSATAVRSVHMGGFGAGPGGDEPDPSDPVSLACHAGRQALMEGDEDKVAARWLSDRFFLGGGRRSWCGGAKSRF